MQDQSARAAPGQALEFAEKSVILLGGVLASMALMAITSVLPLIEGELAHAPSDRLLVKQLVGGVGLAMVVGASLGGVLADRLGLRRLVLLAALVYTIAGTAGLYLNSLSWLLASRLVLGVAAAVIQIISITLINTRLEGAARAKWMGVHIAVAMFGTILVHPIAGLLGELGWRWPFALYGVGAALVLSMLANATGLGLPALGPEKPARSKKSLLSWFPLHYPLLAICLGSVVYLPMVYTPFMLREVGNASPSVISLVLTADSLIGALMALAYGRVRRRVSAHGVFIFCFSATGLGTLAAATASGFSGIFVGMVIYGFGVGWLVANLLTALSAKVSAERQGRAAGLVKAAHFLAAPLAVTVMEPFANLYGPQNAVLAVAGLSFALILIFILRALQPKRAGLPTSVQAPAE